MVQPIYICSTNVWPVDWFYAMVADEVHEEIDERLAAGARPGSVDVNPGVVRQECIRCWLEECLPAAVC